MPKLGCLVKVVLPLGQLRITAHLLDLLAQLLQLVDGSPLLLPLRSHGIGHNARLAQLVGDCLKPLLAGAVGLLLERGLLDLKAHNAASYLIELSRHRVDLSADCGAGLIDKVDRLVWKEAV